MDSDGYYVIDDIIRGTVEDEADIQDEDDEG